MFKKFVASEDVAGQNQAKSSVVRGIRASILENYPSIEHHLDDIIPKKDSVTIIKCREHIEIISLKNEFLFFRQRDGPYVPTLHLLHKYPNMLPWLQVDRGAIKFILSGANIMAPGLTSAGAKMDTDLPENVIVAIMAEGKEHSLCVGMTKMSTDNIRLTNKGVAVESLHYLCDGLWDMISKR